ncbi:MAG TPA: hypothetical protein VIN75_06385, partial [Burkholderiaceae bacterium]
MLDAAGRERVASDDNNHRDRAFGRDAHAAGTSHRVRRRPSHGQLFREAARREAAARHRDEQRLVWALLLSLAFHFLLFLLQFDAPGIGLPGITHPLKERRVLVPELTIVLAPRREDAASAGGARAADAGAAPVAMTATQTRDAGWSATVPAPGPAPA